MTTCVRRVVLGEGVADDCSYYISLLSTPKISPINLKSYKVRLELQNKDKVVGKKIRLVAEILESRKEL